MKKGKEFIFPENVNKDFGVWKDYTLKDILTIILPTFVLAILIIILPPHNLVLMVVKIFGCLIIVTSVIAFIGVKPVKARPNITLRQHTKMKKEYSDRQKLFYIKARKQKEW